MILQKANQETKNGNVYTKGCLKNAVGYFASKIFKFNNWQEVTKEQIDIAMLMPGEYKEKDGKFYIKPGMLAGYICDEFYEEEINTKKVGHITGVPLITDDNKHCFLKDQDINDEETRFERAVAGSTDYNKIKEARKTIRKAFEKDEQFKWGYICNIAMHLYDEICKDGLKLDYNRRNEIAEKMLKVLFYYGEK